MKKNPEKGGCQGTGSLGIIMKKFLKLITVIGFVNHLTFIPLVYGREMYKT